MFGAYRAEEEAPEDSAPWKVAFQLQWCLVRQRHPAPAPGINDFSDSSEHGTRYEAERVAANQEGRKDFGRKSTRRLDTTVTPCGETRV